MPSEIIIELDTDNGQIANSQVMEIPIQGPSQANLLVVITGMAKTEWDLDDFVPDADPDTAYEVKLHIRTGYNVVAIEPGHPRVWKSIVDGNTELLNTTYMALADIQTDEGAWGQVINPAKTWINTDGRVQIDASVALQGDSTLSRVCYEVNILVKRT